MANLALNKNADASNFMFPYQPAKAVDGIVTPLNRWVGSSPLPPSGIPAPVWLRVDLGAFYWINRWVVRQMGSLGWPVPPSTSGYNLVDYKLQGSSDNANWFDIDAVINNSANSTDRTTAPTKVRWVRILVTKGLRCNTNFASIAELEVYDAPNVPYLSALTTSPGSLNPTFSSKVFSYSLNVDNTVTSVSLTPTAASTGSQIKVKVNGTEITGGPSYSVSLPNPGSYNVTITVTSADNLMTETYTVNVTKQGATMLLQSMVLKNNRGGEISLNPAFSSSNLNYNASIGSGVPTVSVTPTAVDPANSTIKVNGTTVNNGTQSAQITMNTGTNVITVEVNRVGGSGQSIYQITVTKS